MYLLYELRCFSRISSPEKGHTEHESKYDNFYVSSISPVSCGHVTRLSRHSVRLMKEWQGVHHSQSKVVRRNVLGIWLLKLLKDSYRSQTLTFEIFSKRKTKRVNTTKLLQEIYPCINQTRTSCEIKKNIAFDSYL